MYKELVKIREALELLAQDQHSVMLMRFPKGCCGLTCNLVATYLESKGYGTFQYILGQNVQQTESHAWLLSLNNRYIVDLTADQFGSNKIIYKSEIEYPLSQLFPKQSNQGNASILSGTKVDNSYHLAYQKILDYLGES